MDKPKPYAPLVREVVDYNPSQPKAPDIASVTLAGFKETNPKDMMGMSKAPMSTVSAVVLAEVGVAMLEGACKYGRHNYRAVGVRSSVYYDAAMRHLMEWWEGTDIDAASGMHHVTKAITTLVVLRDAMIQGLVIDDRPPSSPEFYEELNKLTAEIRQRYAHLNPKHYTIEDVLDDRKPDTGENYAKASN